MLYPHPLPSAEESSFLAILHHFKKVLKFQLLLHETRNEKKKKLQLLLSFLADLSFLLNEGGNLKHFPNFFYYFFLFLSSFLNPWFCLPWMYDCVRGCSKYSPPPPLPFLSVFSFFRNQNQNWYLVSIRLALRHAPLEEEPSPIFLPSWQH